MRLYKLNDCGIIRGLWWGRRVPDVPQQLDQAREACSAAPDLKAEVQSLLPAPGPGPAPHQAGSGLSRDLLTFCSCYGPAGRQTCGVRRAVY